MSTVTIPSAPPSAVSSEIWGDDYHFLRATQARPHVAKSPKFRYVDLFCGVGGLSLGIEEAVHAWGYTPVGTLAMDFDKNAMACYVDNFDVQRAECRGVEELFDGELGAPLTASETSLVNSIGATDLLAGGPPCQGHSDLNNFSRRSDPKNALYARMARAAEVLRPQLVLIENVTGAVHDRSKVVQEVVAHLESLGYYVKLSIVDALGLGVPQRRKRLIILGSLKGDFSFGDVVPNESEPAVRNLKWAIGDLEDEEPTTPFTSLANPNPVTRRRIDYLFDNDVYELPDHQRPACHRDKAHTYKSVYGRLRWDQPSQTITSGFYTMCMGRYVHPSRRRTLTAHEAARIQFFPDFFDFSSYESRTPLAMGIGNAVPVKVGYAVVSGLLGKFYADRRNG